MKKEYNNSKYKDFYINSIHNFLLRVSKDAHKLGITPKKFIAILNTIYNSYSFKNITCGFVDTNYEELKIYSKEIEERVGVQVIPFFLEDIVSPHEKIRDKIFSVDYFITTQFHFNQLYSAAYHLGKETFSVKCRINSLLFLFKNSVFKRLGIVLKDPATIEKCKVFLSTLKGITTVLKVEFVEASDLSGIRTLEKKSDYIVISPICKEEVRRLISDKSKIIPLDNLIDSDSIQKLKLNLLLRAKNGTVC